MSNRCTTTPQDEPAKRELEQVMLQTRMERIGRKLLVLSGKGGVGKSTVAAHLAVALANAGRKVGLLDVDLHGPSIPQLLGLQRRRLGPGADGGIAPIELITNLKVVSVGMMLQSAEQAVIWRGPMKYGAIQQFLREANWGELDDLVIDCPPGTGDEPLAVAQLVGDGAEAVIVTTPQDLAVADVRRSIGFCRTLQLKIAGIVENMSGLVCPHCNELVDLFRTGGGERLAEEMGVPFLGRVPLDPEIVVAGDRGEPPCKHSPEGGSGLAFVAIAGNLLPDCRRRPTGDPKTARNTCPQEPEENNTVKIAIPVAEGKLCMHFGHCQQFAMVEADGQAGQIVSTRYLEPPPHEPGVLPRWLHEQGTDVVVAGGMGQRAQGLFAQAGIRVVVGAPGDEPEQIAAALLNGTLETGRNVCDH
jgi:Mrp family chromosome partitioning ATPase/predicted Fe-Mo cluster-binding NifX family protein